MSTSYQLRPSPDRGGQRADDRSFMGGRPSLPGSAALPVCKLCGAQQTFFLQLAFPASHAWAGHSLAIFACTSCADENHLIPEMLAGVLRGAEIPQGFLTEYQRNFRFLVFQERDGAPRPDYAERVRFIRLEAIASAAAGGSKIGGSPDWLAEDETPGVYAGNVPMRFLLQLEPGLRFETVAGAPPQQELGLDGKPRAASRAHYQLFIGNAIYLFGTASASLGLVYALTQVD